jgi:hypothetical protein
VALALILANEHGAGLEVTARWPVGRELLPARGTLLPIDVLDPRAALNMIGEAPEATNAQEGTWVGIRVEVRPSNLVVAPTADGCLHDSARNHLPVRVNSGSTRFLGAQQDRHRT